MILVNCIPLEIKINTQYTVLISHLLIIAKITFLKFSFCEVHSINVTPLKFTRWCHGSPVHRYGLYALQWIVEVNGKLTPNLDAFVEVTKVKLLSVFSYDA